MKCQSIASSFGLVWKKGFVCGHHSLALLDIRINLCSKHSNSYNRKALCHQLTLMSAYLYRFQSLHVALCMCIFSKQIIFCMLLIGFLVLFWWWFFCFFGHLSASKQIIWEEKERERKPRRKKMYGFFLHIFHTFRLSNRLIWLWMWKPISY